MTLSYHQVTVILILILAFSSIVSAFVSGEEQSSRIAIYQDGSWYIDSDGNGVFGAGDRNAGFGAPLYVPVSGDWNGDNITEIGAYRDGAWYLDYDDSGDWSAGDRNYGYGALNWTPVVGDWNGDGADKIGAYKDGAWYLDTNGNGTFDTGDKNYAFGGAGWEPVIGKWTADGKSKIGVYKDGVYYIDYNGNGTYDTGDKTIVYGTAGSIAITGDWNANSLTEVGTKNGSAWTLDYDGLGGINASTKTYTFGAAGWTPALGDWNADGADKIGIYLNGAWYLDANGNGVWDAGTDKNYAFGSTGWIPVIGKWSEPAAGPAPVANFTGTPRAGTVPLTVTFTDTSTGSPYSWNWSFGDGNFSTSQNPDHTYEIAGDYNVTLIVTKGSQSDNLTLEDYIYVEAAGATYDASLVLNSMPTTMFQGEHYIVDVKMNNTGSKKWFADPANPNLVYLQGLGGSGGDAATFNITHIPMIFANESTSYGESYDFFFYVKAPNTIGNYTPQYQVSSAGGTFGEVASATVNVIENPFHPVVQPNGSKLYTTPFGNADTGISVDIVGPGVYLDDIHASSLEDPRFLINPSLKSGVFNLELNESISYANITIPYDAANVTYTANLSIGYFNGTTGNYTFVPTTVDSDSHTVTAQVSDLSGTFGVLDKNKYQALPALAQTEMGYIDIGPLDNWTVQDSDLRSSHTNWFNGMSLFPPGNYTIIPLGYYHHIQFGDSCVFELYAYQNYYSSGPWVTYSNGSQVSSMVSTLVDPGDSNHALKFNHTGGPIGMSIVVVSSQACGSLTYKLYPGHGPAFRDDELSYEKELNNTAFNKTDTGFDLAVTAYQAVAGCVLGQAGKKGGVLDGAHSLIPGWSSAINDDVTESPAYLVGHVACAIAFPQITLARDFTSDVLRGDPINAVLDSIGYLGRVKNLLKTSGVLTAFVIKHPGTDVRLINGLNDLRMFDDISYIDKFSMYDEVSKGAANRIATNYGVRTEAMENIYLKGKVPLEKAEKFLTNNYIGTWSAKPGKTALDNFEDHYLKHVVREPDNWGSISRTEYIQKAINLINNPSGGNIERYIDASRGEAKIIVYNRYTHELAVGNEAGEISALYKRPEITNPNFPDKVGVDDLVAKGTYIRIN